METQLLEKILGRQQHEDLISLKSDKKILITGGKGSIGKRLAERCPNAIVTDVEDLDVTDIGIQEYNPEYVINLAGDKHAPVGENDCINTLTINTIGTNNLLRVFPDAHHVLASTCKACNPETVYGATKLIAERLVLNAGGTVARFYNVVETSGNVFEIWNRGQGEVYDCQRYFISLDEAVGLLISCLDLKGRYAVNPGEIRQMVSIARLFRVTKLKDRRRGDRRTELLCSTSETFSYKGSLLHITSHHDGADK
jgi:FlaA1/EpsC-like NDP-sugar epimerase